MTYLFVKIPTLWIPDSTLYDQERESEESNMWHIYLFAMYSDDLWQNIVTIELIKCWFIGETEIIHFWDFEI